MRNFIYLCITFIFSVLYANECDRPPTFYKCCVQHTCLPFLEAQYLYWKTQNNGFTSGTIVEGASSSSLRIRPFKPDFKWDSGFRVLCGWDIPYDSWSISASYLYFRTQVSTDFNAGSNEDIAGYWTLTDELASSGISGWKFHEDLIDAILMKSYLVGRSYFITPYIGGRYGWLRQDYKTELFSITPDLGFPSIFAASQKFHGGGPLIGISSNWAIGRNFSFLGKIDIALLYGTVKIRQNLDEVVNMDFETTTRVLNYTQNNQELFPNLQLSLGASWGTCLSKTATFALSVAWEANYWWNQYLLALIQPSSGIFDDVFNRPIIQQGITATASIHF